MKRNDSERRKHPRSRRGFKADGSDLFNHVDNISASGVLCHTKRPVAEMTKLSIEIELPAPVDRIVTAEGIVIRCDADPKKRESFRVAIFYTKLSDADQHAIRDYVEHDLADEA